MILNMTDDREDVMCGTSGRVTHEDDQDDVVEDGVCGEMWNLHQQEEIDTKYTLLCS